MGNEWSSSQWQKYGFKFGKNGIMGITEVGWGSWGREFEGYGTGRGQTIEISVVHDNSQLHYRYEVAIHGPYQQVALQEKGEGQILEGRSIKKEHKQLEKLVTQ